jgi:hypothetical protein
MPIERLSRHLFSCFLIAILFLAEPAFAGLWGVAEVKDRDGLFVYQLYDDPGFIPGCTGRNVNSLVVKLETDGKVLDYGSGCWTLGIRGMVHIWVKREKGAFHRSMFPMTAIVSPANAIQSR